jgi:hypothetical protein
LHVDAVKTKSVHQNDAVHSAISWAPGVLSPAISGISHVGQQLKNKLFESTRSELCNSLEQSQLDIRTNLFYRLSDTQFWCSSTRFSSRPRLPLGAPVRSDIDATPNQVGELGCSQSAGRVAEQSLIGQLPQSPTRC